MYSGSFIRNENAVNIQVDSVLNLVILLIISGSITGVFYQYVDSSSHQAMRTGFTDLGSQIARDITNMYLSAVQSPNDVVFNVKRSIPLTIGGKGYSIELRNASLTSDKLASIDIKGDGFFPYETTTMINSIGPDINAGGTVHSGSGQINITVTKKAGEYRVWIK